VLVEILRVGRHAFGEITPASPSVGVSDLPLAIGIPTGKLVDGPVVERLRSFGTLALLGIGPLAGRNLDTPTGRIQGSHAVECREAGLTARHVDAVDSAPRECHSAGGCLDRQIEIPRRMQIDASLIEAQRALGVSDELERTLAVEAEDCARLELELHSSRLVAA
jgi:hypothetical protein